MAMWEELGIVPTADLKTIRRAYAGRLRGLDPDQDPAAFQRLRQAFEAALSQAEQPARAAPRATRESQFTPPIPAGDAEPTPLLGVAAPPHRSTREENVSPPIAALPQAEQPTRAAPQTTREPQRTPPPPPPRVVVSALRSTGERNVSPPIDDNHTCIAVDDTQWRAMLQACRSALAAGDVEGAFSRLMEGWAQGLVPIAEEDDIVAVVMGAAVDDRTLPGERFQFMARHLDWDKPIAVRTDTNVALRERVLQRLDAEAWYATLLDNATKKDRWPTFVDQQERWLARVLLGMAPRWRLVLVHSNVIRWQLKPYGAFEPWLRDRVDSRRITQLKETLRSNVRDTWPSLYWPWHIILSGLAIFGLMFVTRFRRSSGRAIREENPSLLAWWRRVKQQAKLRGIPLGLVALRPALVLTLRIFFFALALVLAIACIGAAILFPPLGVAIVIVGFVMRRKKRKA